MHFQIHVVKFYNLQRAPRPSVEALHYWRKQPTCMLVLVEIRSGPSPTMTKPHTSQHDSHRGGVKGRTRAALMAGSCA